jgi:hypothetical protein
VGISLLASVGTFLYVTTMHILPEVYCSEEPTAHALEIDTEGNLTPKKQAHGHAHGHMVDACDPANPPAHFSKFCELCFLLAGLYTPLLIPHAH